MARDLLGCQVWVRHDGEPAHTGRIVEVEAARGFDDRACHGWRGETPRLRSLFGPGGRTFVYITYGIHHMLNVVTEEAGHPSGVLTRALDPLRNLPDPARGPGLLTRALGITLAQNGSDLRRGAMRVLEGGLKAGEEVGPSTRVGVEYSGRSAELVAARMRQSRENRRRN